MAYALAAMAAVAIASGINAQVKKDKARKAANKLKNVNPKFRDANLIREEAEGAVRYGYAPEEVADFRASLQRANNQGARMATDRNPNLSGAIQAGINFGNIGALNSFAAQDAALRRNKVNDYVSLSTGQYNNQTQADIRNKYDQEVAYGNAMKQADAEIWNSISMLGYAGASAAGQAGRSAPPQAAPSQTPIVPYANNPSAMGPSRNEAFPTLDPYASTPMFNTVGPRATPSQAAPYAPPANPFTPFAPVPPMAQAQNQFYIPTPYNPSYY